MQQYSNTLPTPTKQCFALEKKNKKNHEPPISMSQQNLLFFFSKNFTKAEKSITYIICIR